MTRQITRRRLLGVTLTGAALFTACSTGAPSPVTGGQPGSQPAGQTSAPVQAQTKGEFRVNLQGEPKTIDPNKANFAQEVAIISAVFEGLFSFDKDLKLVPAAAIEVPTPANGGVSADGRTYTYKLKDGLKWNDGKSVTAGDFEYSLKRTLDPATASPYASFYYDIKGARQFNTAMGTKAAPKQPSEGQLAELRDSVGVNAIDERTLQVELEDKTFIFNQVMALWPAFPVREDVITAKGDSWIEPASYIGNGPWKLSEWEHQVKLVTVPNEHYAGTKPRLAKLSWLIYTDETAAFAAYRNDEIDLTPVPSANISLVQNDPTLKDQVVRNNELVTFSVQMNVTRPPFDNVKVRQAIATALNKEDFINGIRQGIGRVASSWVPPGMPGFDENAGKQYAFNPTKAKQLLSEAGFPDGRGLAEIRFTYADNTTNKELAEWLQGQLKQNLGIELTLDPMESKAYQAAYTANQLQMFWAGWGADYPDPENFLRNIIGTGKSGNHTLFSDPQVDRSIEQALAEPDEAKRLKLWQDAQNRMLDQAPMVPIMHREIFWLKKPQFKGFQVTAKDQRPGNRFYYQLYVE